MSDAPYRIDEDETELVVRVRKSLTGRERISRFVDRLEFEDIRSRSVLTEVDAAELAAEVKRGGWEANRFRARAP